MKTLLCALAMLVTGYSAVEAAEYTYERCDETGQVVVCEKIQPEYLLIPFGYLDSCRSILQGAMQAMDPFVDWRFLFGLAHKDPIETTDQEKIDAFKKWDQAKAQCWTKK